MKIDLTLRQIQIVESIKSKSELKDQMMLDKLLKGETDFNDIENLCLIINGEFLMEGILPSFEPNPYGLELESLLDSVNRARIAP
ncbi:hypothetical protein GTP55_13605 [Duganella sp. FT109W]|uniref:MafI family immunity protein n=1 Tax=Duganella margarita TaxID=2692170 RepID=A0ABW9WHY3_9BURK|nr:hypothetical protein [Duganella margarita]MYN40410.1 hypothetical protein [Duganella margarita]